MWKVSQVLQIEVIMLGHETQHRSNLTQQPLDHLVPTLVINTTTTTTTKT